MKKNQLIFIAAALILTLACGLPAALPTATVPAPATATVSMPTQPPTATATSTLVPTSTSAAPVVPTNTSAPPSGGGILPGSPSGPYAVILVQAGDVLNIRSGPGVGNAIVGSFQPTAAGVMRTGPSSNVSGALWVEVQNPSGGKGWVNSEFLTEYVTPTAFCADPKVSTLLDRFKSAVVAADGESYSALIGPIHGLDLRFWRYGTVANYNRAEARFVFSSTYKVNWGPAPGSGEDTVGTFSQVPLPKLLEVLNATHERHCNDTLDLATFSLQPWPPEYANINFYNLYKPGTDAYGGLDWRAWLVGIEYVQGQPQLFALIHFQWEP